MQVAIERHTSAKHINAIMNHPEVYPWVRGMAEGPLDLGPAIENGNVFALLGEHGGQIYHRLDFGLFEAHSQFTPEGRGEWALEATRKSLHWIFTRTEAMEIMTRCPEGNLPAKALAKAVGGTFEFTNPKGWFFDGKPVPADIYSLKIQDWVRTAPGLVEKGEWFHARLEAELGRHGIDELAHPHDATHDRHVGAACEMFFGGQPQKAAVLYNRVAMFGGYLPVHVIDTHPLIVDIGTALLVMRGDDFFVVPPEKPLH